MFIYGLIDPETKELRYVGASKNPTKRLVDHLKTKPITHKGKWITLLRKRGLIPEVFIIKEIADCYWQEVERNYIGYCQSMGANLTNGTGGGDGLFNPTEEVKDKIRQSHIGMKSGHAGMLHSIESRQKMSESNKGRIPWNKGKSTPKEVREKQSKARLGKSPANKGKRTSDAIRKKLSDAHLGFRHTEETIKRMREVQRLRRQNEAKCH